MSTHKTPYNIILIIADTLRRDFLSCYGNKWIHTENIQRFADESLVFDKAYSASFPTVPMRRDVFTGCYTATYTPWAPMTEIEPVVQGYLSQKGYLTYMIADEPHILENGYHFDKGFDGFEWIRGQEGDRWVTSPKSTAFRCNPDKIRNPERLQKCHMRVRAHWQSENDTFPGRTASAAMRWLEENYTANPFYLYVDFFDPHEPWDPPQYYVDMYDPNYDGEVVDYPLYAKWRDFLTEKELKHCRALYAGEVTLIDRWVGKIIQKIKDLGLWENSVVIVTTDHGFLLGEHGFIGKSLISNKKMKTILSYIPLFEEINHIPCIIHYPNGKTGRTDAMIQPPDFMPTMLEISGYEGQITMGESFKSVLIGEKNTHRSFALSFPYLKGRGIPISMVKDQYFAVFFSDFKDKRADLEKMKQDKAVDGESKFQEIWEDAEDMLFDLSKDPQQTKNIALQNPELMAQMKTKFLEYLDELGTEKDILDQWKMI